MANSTDTRALFALLGVGEDAPWDEVRRAFRGAVRATHPDSHAGNPDAERRLKALNAAWELVNTPAKWSDYIAGRRSPDGPRSSPRAGVDASVGRLQVLRQRAGSAGLRRWKLELDGDVVGTVENGSSQLLEAEPGRHSVRVFYDACSSRRLEVRLRAGDELVLGCRRQSNILLGLFAPGRSLVLEQLERRRFA